jgi:antitoxin component YwqK of YwqJK toxin-antitoxin module
VQRAPVASAPAAPESLAIERPEVAAVTPGVARVQEPAEAAPGALVRVREFHPNGSLFTERSERLGEQGSSTRVGPMKTWFENGQLRCEGAYDDEGKLSGHWRYWDERGALQREGDFAAGLREGDWVEYHANGRKRYEGLLHLGQNEGPWKYWHENGQLMAEGSYVNNAREGTWLFFDEQGAPDARLTGFYEKNVRVR